MKRKKLIQCLWIPGGFATIATVMVIAGRNMQNDKMIRLPAAIRTGQVEQWRNPLSPGNQNDLLIIRQFLKRMDSLRQDSAGRGEYDSICRLRPGLIDSALKAERYYTLWSRLKW